MIIKSLEDLQIFQDALAAADAVSAILRRGCFREDGELRDQLAEASDRIPSNMSEGFGQGTDRHFAHFLGIARGSANEIQAHLKVAKGREYITESECLDLCSRYTLIGKRTTRLIQHLRREHRKERG
jgi:four helix bundle protein